LTIVKTENSFVVVFSIFILRSSIFNILGLTGRIVLFDGEVKGYSFGFPLNDETFCILFEIIDLTIKGLSQYLFREFCREMSNYRYINALDDSGLENLRRAKLSYHPCYLEPAYTITREDVNPQFSLPISELINL